MPTESREYVSKLGLGDYEACIRVRDEVVADIKMLNIPNLMANYYARVVSNLDELMDEDVDVQKATAISGGRFPLLWLNITHNPERLGNEHLQEIEQRHQLALIATARSQLDYFSSATPGAG